MTNAFCIIEFRNSIFSAFATYIPDKTSGTLVPIIINLVLNGSLIWTNEFSNYCFLTNFSFVHGTICHKYQFVNYDTCINTQAIKSFNSQLKYEIKMCKGTQTKNRGEILILLFLF